MHKKEKTRTDNSRPFFFPLFLFCPALLHYLSPSKSIASKSDIRKSLSKLYLTFLRCVFSQMCVTCAMLIGFEINLEYRLAHI